MIDGARGNQCNPLPLLFVSNPVPEFVEYFLGILERFDGGRRAGMHRAMRQRLGDLHNGCAISTRLAHVPAVRPLPAKNKKTP
jgi:hypothetical protein